ncbi:hypothetical protein FRACYDRAFT_238585 [Fragilariopsis cylindrus CCMP1102]|uniref:Uncharacterized protein n=1 Tax=Fragilariopsis cylindrus CCMP1102 TaxID=635003 RepID=A0A1E7FK36_9STRA|nr:hypothetical protein FRACYDRAFT_238585 [Fragilariopsis cylindrus CCMP1102]|eukprot:OEU18153.1 hypothetical protein FRACYDRAFT_238585 [Fragilariopsis cylindrus CCMP1102]
MSGKAVEFRLGVGGEGRRNLSDIRRSASTMASMSTGTDGCIGQPELSFKTTHSNDGSIDHDHILEVESSGKFTCHSRSCPGKYFPEYKDSRSCAFQCHDQNECLKSFGKELTTWRNELAASRIGLHVSHVTQTGTIKKKEHKMPNDHNSYTPSGFPYSYYCQYFAAAATVSTTFTAVIKEQEQKNDNPDGATIIDDDKTKLIEPRIKDYQVNRPWKEKHEIVLEVIGKYTDNTAEDIWDGGRFLENATKIKDNDVPDEC